MVDIEAEEVTAAYRALGRYLVEFSQLMHVLADGIAWTLMIRGLGNRDIGELLTGEMNPYELTNSYFGVLRRLADPPYDADEEAVAATLQRRVSDAYTHRNTVMHGAWFVGGTWSDTADHAALIRTKPGRRPENGPPTTRDTYNVATIEQWSDGLQHLRRLVWELALQSIQSPGLSLGNRRGTRVRDVLVLRDGKVLREGPEALSGNVAEPRI